MGPLVDRQAARGAAVACVVGVAALAARAFAPEQQAAIVRELRGGVLDAGVVAGVPFSAVAETNWQPDPRGGDQPWRVTARYYRDTRGRVRVEQALARSPIPRTGESSLIFVSPHPDLATIYLLSESGGGARPWPRGVASMMTGATGAAVPITSTCVVVFRPARALHMLVRGDGPPDEEPIGHRMWSGVHVIGTRLRTTLPAGTLGSPSEIAVVEERWVSPELRVIVHSRYEDSRVGVVEFGLSSITRVEPSPALFEIDEPAPSEGPLPVHLQFDNPYQPGGCRHRP